MKLKEIIKIGIENNASDIHITEGISPVYRIHGELTQIVDLKLTASITADLAIEVLGKDNMNRIFEKRDMDVSYTMKNICRCRINIYLDNGNISMAIRIIPFLVPDFKTLYLPSIIEDIEALKTGLVLVTGSTGSGKSTTISTIIDLINKRKSSHIITIEDPIEYLHVHNKSIINQREIGTDTKDFISGIRGALRQDPDVIVIGEMRDPETISAAINAAETGHLVLSTIHTDSVKNTVSRIIDSFAPEKQNQIKTRLASVLSVVISQKLLPAKGTGRIVATEVMISNDAIKNIIRENKIHQINNLLQTGNRTKMNTMDQSLLELYKRKKITQSTLLQECTDKDYIKKFI